MSVWFSLGRASKGAAQRRMARQQAQVDAARRRAERRAAAFLRKLLPPCENVGQVSTLLRWLSR
jgi:hypothetical protein